MDESPEITLMVSAKLTAEQIAYQLNHEQFITLVMQVLEYFACAEVDEELITKLWRVIQGCYEGGEKPTLEALLQRYPIE